MMPAAGALVGHGGPSLRTYTISDVVGDLKTGYRAAIDHVVLAGGPWNRSLNCKM
jgi:hypothetical protein